MGRMTWWKTILYITLILVLPSCVQAQTATYHLHNEPSSDLANTLQLKPAGPDRASVAFTTNDLKQAAVGEYPISTYWETEAGVPNTAGIIPAGATVTLTLWMKKTANSGTMYPRAKLFLDTSVPGHGSSVLICTTTGSTALTTTLAQYTLTCNLATPIQVATTNRFYVTAGVNLTATSNKSVRGEVDIEGTLNGNYDSRVVVPLPIPPSISNISPTLGQVGTSVTVNGSNFGATQGTSTIKFNGTTATPTTWSDTTIVAAVPAGATTGPVIVTVSGAASNGVTFTVVIPGTIAGTITRSSDGIPISGALVEALQSSVVKGSATTTTNGAYSIANLVAGTYDVRVSAAGYLTQLITGISVAAVATSTVNAALSPPPVIASLSPSSGLIGTSVTISGSYFSATQGTSTVTFNGVSASPTSWSATSIVAPVPPSATTGPVVVTVFGGASNGVTFTVLLNGGIAGTITRVSDSTAISGALIEALQSGVVKASASSAANGSYSISGVVAGTYDLRISANGYVTKLRIGIAVAGNGTATVDVALSKPGTISGKVTQLDGTTAIVGAGVEVSQGTTTTGTSTTNATGDYSIGGLNPGTYTVQASAIGYKTQNLAGVTVSEDSTTTSTFSLEVAPAGTGVSYIYDKLGRLIAAVDLAGDTARYNYDEVGNLLSISRQPSSSVSIIEFTPGSGTVGASLTIYGTGFSATPSQDTVTFNGAAAPVTSATVTQIATSVPTGATTGLIAVTTPSGSATSSGSFTVTASTGAPTITGFTPTIGSSGTSVTISGTNFETTTANNKVQFNIKIAGLSSSTATSISTTFPAAGTSGRISVATPYGKAVSTDDFFIPPAPYTAADVEYTGRMAIGENKTVTINTANKIALLLFDGSAGRSVSLTMTGAIIGNSDVSIINPDGSNLFPPTYAGDGYIDAKTLPATGTYTILFDPRGTSTGSVTLMLYDVVDVTGTITPGGPPVTVNITTPTQNARLTFSGAAGQNVGLTMTGAIIGNSDVSMINPDGSNLFPPTYAGDGYIDAKSLPATGTYTIFFNPRTTNTGTVTLTLYDVVDVTGTITPGGPPVTVNITTPTQNARLTFSGAAGQNVGLTMTGAIIGNSDASTINPDGSNLFPPTYAGAGYIDAKTLPATGTYTIFFNPRTTSTGSVTLTLYDVVDVTGTISPGGPPVTVNITTPTQNARLTFSGTAGQNVGLTMTGAIIGNSDVSIINPDGSNLFSPTYAGAGYIDTKTLPATGTYTIFFNPRTTNTGTVTLTLYDVIDVSGSITPGGPPVTVNITTPTQNARLSFSGTAGQNVGLTMTGAIIGNSDVSIINPDGSNLFPPTYAGAGYIDAKTLPAAGTYTIFFNPRTTNTGTVTLTLYDVVDVSGSITPGGPPVTVNITTPTQNARLTFSGTAGQQVTVHVTGNTIGSVAVSLLRVDGTVLTSVTTSSASFNLAMQTLPANETYTIKIDPPGINTGSLDVSVTSP